MPNTVSGDTNAADIDNPADLFLVESGTTSFGSWSVTSAGVWTYALNNANATVNALNNGGMLPDSFVIRSADGTPQTISITINGRSDAVVLAPVVTIGADPNDFDDAGGTPAVTAQTITDVSGSGTFDGSNLADSILAGNGNDTVYGHDGDDQIFGQGGGDTSLFGQRGDDRVSGGEAGDTIYGGSGADMIFGFEGPANTTNNTDRNDGGDSLFGGSGADVIYGQDGNDRIIGGFGDDTLTGNGGRDTFSFLSVLDRGDSITDFQTGTDRLDLSAIDANTTNAAGTNDTFAFGGTTPTANGIWTVSDGANTLVYGDTDGNVNTVEFYFTLVNTPAPLITDYTL